MEAQGSLLCRYAAENWRQMLRRPAGVLRHPFLVPGSASYNNCLWDWDSWLTDIALRQIAADSGEAGALEELGEYERGCVLNFLEAVEENGRTPICITPDGPMVRPDAGADPYCENIHKPCLAQHAAFLVQHSGEAEWLRPYWPALERFLSFYAQHCRHASGLYFWLDDFAIGVDNDPCTFYRPKKSSASIFLNCLMARELDAMEYLARKFGYAEAASRYAALAQDCRRAVREHCWDERDGFYYSADLALLPVDPASWLHSGCPRHWDTLLQRIDCWSGFLVLWAGIASLEEAQRILLRARDERTFCAPYGIRTLSPLEKMYRIVQSGNPSCWLGPVWGISNFLVWRGLVRYGFEEDANLLAEKTITLFDRDLEQNGVLHEYYDPDTGKGVNNPGFQNWNLLAVNMLAHRQGRPIITEF